MKSSNRKSSCDLSHLRPACPWISSIALSVSLFHPSKSNAALNNYLTSEPAIKIFKNPAALFPSGEMNRKDLEKTFRGERVESHFLVQRGQSLFWLKESQLIRSLQLTDRIKIKNNPSIFRLIQIRGTQAQLEDAQGKKIQVNQSQLIPSYEDLGWSTNILETHLKTSPDWQSDSHILLKAKTRLKLLDTDENWALVSLENDSQKIGWVDLSNLILKADFAQFVKRKNSPQWIAVSYRQGSDLVTKLGEKIALKEITHLAPKDNLAISVSNDAQNGLAYRQNLQILEQDFEPWNFSQTKEFGTVFWKKGTQKTSKTINSSPENLSTEDILKKEIYSASFHPQIKEQGLISSNGIYATQDGLHWQALPRFGNHNMPVFIDENGHWFVGNLRSTDKGKSFHPYFRWEPLARVLEERQKSPANDLKIKAITPLKSGFLRFEVETQKGKLFLSAKLNKGFISSWNYD